MTQGTDDHAALQMQPCRARDEGMILSLHSPSVVETGEGRSVAGRQR